MKRVKEVHIYFLENKGDWQRWSKFNKPKKRKNMDSSFCISLSTCIVPEPTATKRALEICPEALDNVSVT